MTVVIKREWTGLHDRLYVVGNAGATRQRRLRVVTKYTGKRDFLSFWQISLQRDEKQVGEDTTEDVPIVEDFPDSPRGRVVYSKIDSRSGYHQLEGLEKKDIPRRLPSELVMAITNFKLCRLTILASPEGSEDYIAYCGRFKDKVGRCVDAKEEKILTAQDMKAMRKPDKLRVMTFGNVGETVNSRSD
ncbi:hypothetical protein Tco_0990238 [Tanacetum coccineum]|uniref:Reverse transcriptase n=1 Tax=Tanacetum coccineum TaxID=301880 RepID=A0ABQ5EWC2_9ASTR